jgi:AcrR family transcriptional regulator
MTREKILDEALQLLLRTGVRRFRVSELAERLGVVKSAVYHHFPGGKEEVVAALFEREEGRVVAVMEEAVATPGSSRERLLRLVRGQAPSHRHAHRAVPGARGGGERGGPSSAAVGGSSS